MRVFLILLLTAATALTAGPDALQLTKEEAQGLQILQLRRATIEAQYKAASLQLLLDAQGYALGVLQAHPGATDAFDYQTLGWVRHLGEPKR